MKCVNQKPMRRVVLLTWTVPSLPGVRMLDPGEKGRLGNRRVDCLTDTTRGDLNERGVHMELLLLDECGKGA